MMAMAFAGNEAMRCEPLHQLTKQRPRQAKLKNGIAETWISDFPTPIRRHPENHKRSTSRPADGPSPLFNLFLFLLIPLLERVLCKPGPLVGLLGFVADILQASGASFG